MAREPQRRWDQVTLGKGLYNKRKDRYRKEVNYGAKNKGSYKDKQYLKLGIYR
jgi:hypothetical protein